MNESKNLSGVLCWEGILPPRTTRGVVVIRQTSQREKQNRIYLLQRKSIEGPALYSPCVLHKHEVGHLFGAK